MIKNYTYFVNKYSEELELYLIENNIKYDITLIMRKIPIGFTFKFSNTRKDCNKIISDLELMEATHYIVNVTYNDKELEDAEYLWLYPGKQSIDILNEDNFTYLCQFPNEIFGGMSYRHEIQIGDIVIRKEPSTKKRTAFWFESTGLNYIFTDFRVKNLVKSNNLQGIEFRDVYLKNGKKSEILFQIDAQIRLYEENLIFSEDTKIKKCPNCGRNQYLLRGDQLIHISGKKLDLSKDLFITDTIFGDGGGYKVFIISQRFYQLLKKYNLAGGLDLSPVIVEY